MNSALGNKILAAKRERSKVRQFPQPGLIIWSQGFYNWTMEINALAKIAAKNW